MEKLFVLRHILIGSLLIVSKTFAADFSQTAADYTYAPQNEVESTPIDPSKLISAPIYLKPDAKNKDGAVRRLASRDPEPA